MIIKSVFLLLFLCAFALAVTKNEIEEYKKQLTIGINASMTTGKSSSELETLMNRMNLHSYISNSPGSYIDTEFICIGCSIIIDAIVNQRRLGKDRYELGSVLSDACKTLKIQSDPICDNLINLNIDIILHIIDHKPDVDGVRACSIILQNLKCVPLINIDWEIKIHEDAGVSKIEGNGKVVKILHVTDIHYDPVYEIGSLAPCENPLCCQPDSGNVTDISEAAGYWTDYRFCDIPKHTLIDSLNQMAGRHKDIDYVYFTGDIIGHRIWSTTVKNNTRDMITVLDALADAFGDIPVYPIVGNHEPHPLNVWTPEDVKMEISSQFVFDLTAKYWTRWLPKYTAETIVKGGYYTVLVKPGFRIIALNSNVAYSYNWWLIFEEVDPYGQLQWMENVLWEAEKNNEAVHILSHVPSGDDTCYKPWAEQFYKIVARYSKTITGIFNGHTHDAEFNIYYSSDSKEPINFALNAGSLTPFGNKNPNYRIVSVDEKTHDVIDFEEWSFNVSEANSKPHESPRWHKLYSFKEAYGLNDFSPTELHNLVIRMVEDQNHTLLKKYHRYISREGPDADSPCNDICQQKLICKVVVNFYNDTAMCDNLLGKWV